MPGGGANAVETTAVGRFGPVEEPLKSSSETRRPVASRQTPITPTSHAGRPAAGARGTSGVPRGTTSRAITRTANSRGRSTAASSGSTSTSSGLMGSMRATAAMEGTSLDRAKGLPAGPRYSSHPDGNDEGLERLH